MNHLISVEMSINKFERNEANLSVNSILLRIICTITLFAWSPPILIQSRLRFDIVALPVDNDDVNKQYVQQSV